MGFGLLFIGYIIAFVAKTGLGDFLFAGMLVGGCIMFLGLCELRKYCPTFLYAIIANVLFLICSFYETTIWAQEILNIPTVFGQGMATYVEWLEFMIEFAFNIAILYGIADISRRVDYMPTREKAIRNIVFVVLFNILQLVVLILPHATESENPFFVMQKSLMLILLVLQLVYTVINAFLIFKCYAVICPAGEENMERKKSRIDFINKWRDIQDEKEEKAIESTKQYVEDKLRKRNEKLTRKNKKKK